MAKMSMMDLQALINSAKSDALAAMSAAQLSEERARAMDYYLGHMREDMPAEAGRSRAVSTDVASANNFIKAGYRLYRPRHPWGWPHTLYWRKSIM